MEGAELVVGVALDDSPIKQDRFIWLSNEDYTCGTDSNGVALTGPDACTID
jgi:hypothetical protein